MELVKRFIRDEQGLETVEYAIILGLIVVGTIALVIVNRQLGCRSNSLQLTLQWLLMECN